MGLHPDFIHLPIAHRGLHSPDVPENSLPAFRAAINAGYAIELDIQPAADGTPMVFHDYDLNRMSASECYIADLDLKDLADKRLAGTDESIPTLADSLREIAGRVPLLIDIKDQDGRLGSSIGDVHKRVAELLMRYNGPVAVMSFNPHTVAAFGQVAPQITRGLVSCVFDKNDWPMLDDEARGTLGKLSDFERIGAQFVSHYWKNLNNPVISDLKSRGVPVLCWTIENPEDEAVARKYADGITFENYRP